MKILFLTPWYPYTDSPNHGIFVQDQAAAIARQHDVTVVASEVNYQKFGLFSCEVQQSAFRGVNEHRIRVNRSLPFLNQFNYFVITLWHAIRISRKTRPDIVHGNIGYPGAFWGWVVSFFARCPYVVTEHASRFDGHFRSWFHRWLTVFSMRRANALIAVSTYSADVIFKAIGRKPVVIANIIDFEKFGEPVFRPPQADGVFNIGFLGVLANDKKGLDILLNALTKITRPYILHVGGGGSLLDHYKQMAASLNIASRCQFYGNVDHRDVPAFMRKLDFFVSASRFESFGMVIVEAMGVGLPAVVTSSGGVSDFVNAQNGILVAKEDPVKLGEGIATMMAEFETFDRPAIARFARSHYSAAVFLTAIESVYRGLQAEQ